MADNGLLMILKASYNLTPETITKLPSYYNFNYLIKAKTPRSGEQDADIPSTTERFIVKLFNPLNSSYFGNLELQHAVMLHLARKGFPTSRPIPTTVGDSYVKCGEDMLLQVLTFIEGKSANESTMMKADLEEVGYKVGVFLGRFHNALENFNHEIPVSTITKFVWFSENVLEWKGKLSFVEETQIKSLIEKYMGQYQRGYLGRLHELRKSFIHGDFSDANVILKKSSTTAPSSGEWRVSGIIDFEYCFYGYLVGELGTCIAYFMSKAASVTGCDVIKVSREIIRGFETFFPLTFPEKEVLFEATLGRLISSYISASHQSHLHPENRDYIFAQARHIPKVLVAIEAVGRKGVVEAWFSD